MYYVGIDIAKSFHIACVLGEDNNLLKKNFRVESEISCFINQDFVVWYVISVIKWNRHRYF